MQRWKLISLAVGISGLMAGCQSWQSAQSSASLWDGSLGRVLNTMAVKQDMAGLAELHCAGGVACEFAKVNGMSMIDIATHSPSMDAIKASMIRYEPEVGGQPLPQYFVALQPGVSEVSVRFYPVTLDRAESFTFIHDFRVNRVYRLKTFRQRSASSGSLLDIATPGALCVDLMENDKLRRRFCRPYDPMTGMGEFVEQAVSGA